MNQPDKRLDDTALLALERTLTMKAFRSLPQRWREILDLTEVRGLRPRMIAEQLGMTANSVAALAYRARRGLQSRWISLNLADDTLPAECRAGILRLAGLAMEPADPEPSLDVHLGSCTRCLIVSEELADIGHRLGLILRPVGGSDPAPQSEGLRARVRMALSASPEAAG